MSDKSSYRKTLRERRRSVSAVEAERSARLVVDHFDRAFQGRVFREVALYSPMDGEIDCRYLGDFLKEKGARLSLPKVSSDTLIFYADREVNIGEIDLMIIPGVAFDVRGYRIGFGKGYYDRVLSAYSGMKVGLAYDFQRVPELPNDPWDIPMDAVLTEQGFYVKRNLGTPSQALVGDFVPYTPN